MGRTRIVEQTSLRSLWWKHRVCVEMTTSVCFDCRIHSANSICHICRNKLINLGTDAKIPKKNDKRGWKKLADVYKRRIANHFNDREFMIHEELKRRATNSLMWGNYRKVETINGKTGFSRRDKKKYIFCSKKTCHGVELKNYRFPSMFVYLIDSRKPICKYHLES